MAIKRRAHKLELHRDDNVINIDKGIRNKVRVNAWSEEETALLKEIYEHNTKEFIIPKFNRSWNAIRWAAQNIGLSRDRELIVAEMVEGGKTAPIREDFWTVEEDSLLKEIYENNLQDFIVPKFKNRTWQAIRERAVKLGLSRDKEQIRQDRNDTLMEQYGATSPFSFERTREKSRQTNLERYGVEYAIGSDEIREKAHKTVQDRYGVDNVFQSEEIKEKISEAFYKSGTQKCSKQQLYLSNLLGGKINYPVGGCNLDILLEDNIACEYDGGGHSLCVKLGSVTAKDFNDTERRRELFLKSKGFSIIRIISEDDFLPEDTIIFKMVDEAKAYLKTGHSWINFNINEKKVVCREFNRKYDFGNLRQIRKEV